MEVLVLGGTQWVGREFAREAMRRGHAVTCLARGVAGAPASGARLVVADRDDDAAYDGVLDRDWDAVIDVTRQPGHSRRAAAALAERARHWTFVSSGNVYARHDLAGADESGDLMPPLADDVSAPDTYGEAKSAIEEAYRAALADRLLVVRPGLIAGPGDPSDRPGYYVARAARDDGPMLVPDLPGRIMQVIDVRDLVAFALDRAERGEGGAVNTVGDAIEVAEYVRRSRAMGGHGGDVVPATADWLAANGVAEWSGDESLPLWVDDPEWASFMHRSNAAAKAAGLRLRPLDETLVDQLAWERELGLDRPRRAGLSAERERGLVELARAAAAGGES